MLWQTSAVSAVASSPVYFLSRWLSSLTNFCWNTPPSLENSSKVAHWKRTATAHHQLFGLHPASLRHRRQCHCLHSISIISRYKPKLSSATISCHSGQRTAIRARAIPVSIDRPLAPLSTVRPLSIHSPVHYIPFWAVASHSHRQECGRPSLNPTLHHHHCRVPRVHLHMIMSTSCCHDCEEIRTGALCAICSQAHLEISRNLCTPPGLVQHFFELNQLETVWSSLLSLWK